MIVMKFGGTSVADAAMMRKVINLVAEHKDRRPLVVSSACAGMTAKLKDLADLALTCDSKGVAEIVGAIRDHHLQTCEQLLRDLVASELVQNTCQLLRDLCADLHRLAEGILLLRECTPRTHAKLLSFGERLSTTVLAAGFEAMGHKCHLLDAREIMVTDSLYMSATVDMDATRRRCLKIVRPHLQSDAIVLTQGFIGADKRGVTSINGRGGSDLSAAIFGAALCVEEIQIWTDVSGVYTTDPRLVSSARTVERMTFAEAGELAYFGAKVLHPDTIRPAVADAIPVRVRNTFDSHHQGTLLVRDALPDVDGIRALAIRKDMILLSFAMRSANQTSRFLAAVYAALVRREIEAFAAQGSEHHYVLCLEDAHAAAGLAQEFSDYADVEISKAAVLCAVGPRFAGADGVASVARLTEVLQPFGALFVQHHVGNISILAAVPDENGHAALRAAHSLIS